MANEPARKLTIDQAAKAIASAFRPLRCVVEDFDYYAKLRFRVFDLSGNAVLRMDELLLSQVSTFDELKNVLEHARQIVISKGHMLEPLKLDLP